MLKKYKNFLTFFKSYSSKKLESGKNAPGLTSLDCDNKLLTDEHFGVWFEIYEWREQITILVLQTDEQRRTDSQRLTVNELERESAGR